jgi:hypothetical protein
VRSQSPPGLIIKGLDIKHEKACLSESSLLGWFYEVSLIVIIKVRSQSPPGLIIKGLDNQARKGLIISDNQVFHDVSPNLSNSADDSPDQTVDRIKMNITFPFSPSTAHHLDLKKNFIL